jgi:hypothetical protein
MKTEDILLTYAFTAAEIKALYRDLEQTGMSQNRELRSFSERLKGALYNHLTIEEAEQFFNE